MDARHRPRAEAPPPSRPAIFSGHNLQKALDKAAKHFGIAPDALDYRIVKRRLLGLLQPAYVIEAAPNELAGKPLGRPSEQDGLPEPGVVGLRDGKIIYIPPKHHGKYPTITAGEGVRLTVNGKRTHGPVVLFPDHEVTLTTENQEPVLDVSVSIRDDNMQAEVAIVRRPGLRYRLKDSEPVTDLVVEAEQVSVAPPRLTEEALRTALHDAGVVYGIDHDAVRQAVHDEGDGRYVVAKGTPPVSPEDDGIEWLVPVTAPEWTLHVDPYLTSLSIAKPGEVLAVYQRGCVGRPGRDVRGNTIMPQAPKRCTFRVADGVVLREKGDVQQAVAVRTGRPTLVNGALTVLPMKLIDSDVTGRDGILSFEGDVAIRGNVLDGSKVRAGGSIVIQGAVSGAHLVAGGDVIVHRGITRSEVYAGGEGAALARIHGQLDRVMREFSPLLRNMLQARKHPGTLLQEAQDTPEFRFERLRTELAGLFDAAESEWEQHILGPLENTVRRLHRILDRAEASQTINVTHLVDLYKSLLSWHERMKRAMTQARTILAPHVQNSRLVACGNIVITESGCYQSRLIATLDVLLQGDRGFFRASEVTVGGLIEAEEIGAYAGSPTSIEGTAETQVRARTVHPGTILNIADEVYRFITTQHVVAARLEALGTLEVSCLREEGARSSSPARMAPLMTTAMLAGASLHMQHRMFACVIGGTSLLGQFS